MGKRKNVTRILIFQIENLKNSQEINESNKNYVQNSDSLIISKEIIIKKLSENSQLIEKKENKSIK